MDSRYKEIIAGLEGIAARSDQDAGEMSALIGRLKQTLDHDDERLSGLVDLLRSIAALDFEKRVPISDDDGLTNALASGLNMLAEHLGRATVSTEFFASVLNTMKDGLLVVAPDGNIERTNPALLAMLHSDPTDVLGTRVNDLIAHPDGRPMADLQELLKIDEARIQSTDGRALTVLVSGSKLDSPTGAGRLVLVVHDITERKKMESELEAERQKAEESTRMKSAFLSNMSHEIRTPLNAIIGFTDLLLSESLSESQRRQILTVHKSGELLLNIIGEILDISRIEAGEVDIRKAPFSLAAMLDNLDATGRILLAESKKPIEFARSADTAAVLQSPSIMGDEHRVAQILNNMVVNAIKFTEAGKIEYGVALEAPDRLRFFVRDTGMGIPPAEQEHVFESFRRGRAGKVRTIGGVGLGLAISRKLVRMMGGEMGLESQVGADHGSTFFFTLPFEPVESARVAANDGGTQEIAGKDRRILLVEDDQDNRTLATMLLKKFGFQVETAVNGQDAIAKFEELQNVALILMDVNMPVMDGLQATREIRKRETSSPYHAGARNIPIIALTAHATEEQKEACLDSGCDDFLTKPIARQRLIEKLNVYLTKE